MKKNIWMVLAAASLMTACDYNENILKVLMKQTKVMSRNIL